MAWRGAAANARLMMLAMAAAVASRGAAVLSDYSKHSGSHRNDSHFEVLTPYEGEIFAQEDCFFEFRLHGDLVPRLASGHEILVGINGNEAMRTRDAYTSIKAPGLPAGLHYLILQVLDSAGAPGLLDFTVAFEVTEHPPPEQIVPLPAGTVGVRSDELPLAEDLDPQPYSAVLQQMFYDHQHPPLERCKTAPFVIWEPWGIVGFGAQLLGLACPWSSDQMQAQLAALVQIHQPARRRRVAAGSAHHAKGASGAHDILRRRSHLRSRYRSLVRRPPRP